MAYLLKGIGDDTHAAAADIYQVGGIVDDLRDVAPLIALQFLLQQRGIVCRQFAPQIHIERGSFQADVKMIVHDLYSAIDDYHLVVKRLGVTVSESHPHRALLLLPSCFRRAIVSVPCIWV